MYNNYNPSFNMERLTRMKEDIENQIKSYQLYSNPRNLSRKNWRNNLP